MCGGYTRICVKCGMCGKVDQRPIADAGVCVRCGHVNGPEERLCAQCGTPLPKPPGAPTSQVGKPGDGNYDKRESND